MKVVRRCSQTVKQYDPTYTRVIIRYSRTHPISHNQSTSNEGDIISSMLLLRVKSMQSQYFPGISLCIQGVDSGEPDPLRLQESAVRRVGIGAP